MATYNDEMVVVFRGEIMLLIKEEVSKFRQELAVFIGEANKNLHLHEKPLNAQQVANRYSVSKTTVYKWMKKGLIRGFKQGKGRFFYLHEIDQSLTRYKDFEALQKNGAIDKDKTYTAFRKERK